MSGLYKFIFLMWVLIIIGGGVLVLVLGPLEVPSEVKAVIAILLVCVWILILSKLKNVIFRKEMMK